MATYNFLNISPSEFESLSKEIVEAELKLPFEIFTDGKDLGIDLRYSKNKANDIIVQCKRFSSFRQLYANLKKEIEKVKILNPSRYIVVTSVGLSPHNKADIQKLFEPFITKSSDIIGGNELNAFLIKYPEIEKNNFKLWLSSVNILEVVLKSKIINQSNFEKEALERAVKLYVNNGSFSHALRIINKNNFVIISGIPGIGKTTLGRILAYQFLATGYEEFIYLSDSIQDGYSLFNESKKQIFFFDDFLGRNFLETKLMHNEDKRIMQFIDKINSSNDKVLIFTTREYILSQAKEKYDLFNALTIDLAKCIVDLSKYTKLIRAKILYNHLYFSGLPKKYIKNMLEGQAYQEIIKHRNYNPRIIETITNPKFYNEISHSEYSTVFLKMLEYPDSIWMHVYENQVSKLSQCLLGILLTTAPSILMEDVQKLILNFAGVYSYKYGFSYSEIEFEKSLRELENTFISIEKDSEDKHVINFYNPSVQDFLVNYFCNKVDFLSDILNSALFFNQVIDMFIFPNEVVPFGESSRIVANEQLQKVIAKILIDKFDTLNNSTIKISYQHGKRIARVRQESKLAGLCKLVNKVKFIKDKNLTLFIVEAFKRYWEDEALRKIDFDNCIDLIFYVNEYKRLDQNQILSDLVPHITNSVEMLSVNRLAEIFPECYKKFINEHEFLLEDIDEILYEEVDSAPEDELEYFLRDHEELADIFNYKFESIHMIKERIKRKEDYEMEMLYQEEDDSEEDEIKPAASVDEVDVEIKSMFDSLWNC